MVKLLNSSVNIIDYLNFTGVETIIKKIKNENELIVKVVKLCDQSKYFYNWEDIKMYLGEEKDEWFCR